MNRQAQAVVMLLLGGAVVKVSLTDVYLRYVKEGLRPFLIAAGVLLIAAAVMTLWYDLRGNRPAVIDEAADQATEKAAGQATEKAAARATDRTAGQAADRADDHAEADDGHGHAHHEPRVGWLLILPVLGLLLVAPPALGSYAAGQAGSVLTAQNANSDYPPLPAGDPVAVGLLDYASRAAFDDGKSLTGRSVQLTGFVTPGADGRLMLARIILSCCAADGRPIKIGLAGNAPTAIPADTWVQVIGTYSTRVERDPVNDAEVPYLEVETWLEIDPPKRVYE